MALLSFDHLIVTFIFALYRAWRAGQHPNAVFIIYKQVKQSSLLGVAGLVTN